MFKDKRISHDFFGNLTFSNGYWTGEMEFLESLSTVYLYIYADKDQIDSRFINVWKNICLTYKDIELDTVKVIAEYFANVEFPVVELKDDFGVKDISLEAVSIESNLSVKMHWGVMPKDSGEYDFQITTEHSNDIVNVLGVSD